MWYIAVRLFCLAVPLVLAGEVVDDVSTTPEQAVGQHVSPPTQSATDYEGLPYMPMQSKCSAPDNGATLATTLEKLVRLVEPTMPDAQAMALADGPLLADARERIPDRDVTSIDVAATVCVMRLVNDDKQVVWRVELKLPQQEK